MRPFRGKATCKILKDIRRQIAEANDIELVIKECTYQGDCAGTCPKCEAEVSYLERELARRQAMGKAVCISGIAASALFGLPAAAQECTTDNPRAKAKPVVAAQYRSSVIRGAVGPANLRLPLYITDNGDTIAPENLDRLDVETIENVRIIRPDGHYAYIVDGKRVSAEEADALRPEETLEIRLFTKKEVAPFYRNIPEDGLIVIRTNRKHYVRVKVIDKEDGEPVPGAAVQTADKKRGAITDYDGIAELILDSQEEQITVDYIAYKSESLPAAPFLLFALENAPGEVVLTGYGTAPQPERKKTSKLKRRNR